MTGARGLSVRSGQYWTPVSPVLTGVGLEVLPAGPLLQCQTEVRFSCSLIVVALIALPSVLAFDGAFEYLQPDRFYLSFIDYGIGISQMKNEVIRVVDAPAARRPVYDRKGSQILVRRGGRRTDIHIG